MLNILCHAAKKTRVTQLVTLVAKLGVDTAQNEPSKVAVDGPRLERAVLRAVDRAAHDLVEPGLLADLRKFQSKNTKNQQNIKVPEQLKYQNTTHF